MSCKKLTIHLCRSTLVAPRCTKTFVNGTGGLTWSKTLPVMSNNVTFVVASRQNIKDLLELCNHLLFLNGNRTRSRGTSSPNFPDHRKVMMLSLPSSTDSQGCALSASQGTITASQLADLYVSRIVSLHDILLEISSDRVSLFTSRFWESFQEDMGTHLSFSTAYHP